jgi:hypothetical protein
MISSLRYTQVQFVKKRIHKRCFSLISQLGKVDLILHFTASNPNKDFVCFFTLYFAALSQKISVVNLFSAGSYFEES